MTELCKKGSKKGKGGRGRGRGRISEATLIFIGLVLSLILAPGVVSAGEFNQTGTKYDATANDSDKSWTVPANRRWKISWIHVAYTSTATVGNRQLKMEVLDSGSNLRIDAHAGAVQAASNTYHYEFMKGIYRETSFVDNSIQVPIPYDVVIPAGWSLRIYDESAVDAAADDMTVSFQYQYD